MKPAPGENWITVCSPYDTIGKIKESMRKERRFSVDEQSLALPNPGKASTVLQEGKSLADYGVFYNATLLLHQEIEIFVKDHQSRNQVYTISPSQSVLDFKKKIEVRTNVSVNQQCLVYNDKELNDTNTLASYNIRSKDTVYLLLRLRGGHLSFGATSL